MRFQINLMKVQMSLEDIFLDLAMSIDENVVILCDRGTMDGSAYVSPEAWQALLDETGWN